MEATIRGHVRAFEHLGGVAATCLYDNMKVVVERHEGDEPVYNTRFLAFATHYGFRPVACRPRRPQTKGKLERPFYFVETNLLSGRGFRSLEHLNEVTAWWLAEVADVRIHRQTRRRPIDMHAEEVPHLIPLPERPYEVAEVVYRTVDVEGFISYAEPLLGALALYRTGALRADHGRGSDRLRSAVGGLGPASAVPADGKTPPELSQRTSSASRRDAAARSVASAVHRLGAVGRTLPGGALGRATLWRDQARRS